MRRGNEPNRFPRAFFELNCFWAISAPMVVSWSDLNGVDKRESNRLHVGAMMMGKPKPDMPTEATEKGSNVSKLAKDIRKENSEAPAARHDAPQSAGDQPEQAYRPLAVRFSAGRD